MCLTVIDKIHDIPSYHIETRWKCFAIGNYNGEEQPRFPFFSNKVGFQVPQDHWLLCFNNIVGRRMIGDPITYYLSGFHTFSSERAARYYATTSLMHHLTVAQVQIMGVRTTGMQGAISNVDVTDWMLLRSEDWIEARRRESHKGGES